MSYLQSYVMPICLYEERDEFAHIHSLIGTCFIINSAGYILTARHVAQQAVDQAAHRSLLLGVVVKANDGKSPNSEVQPIDSFEHAPNPFDVSITKIDYSAKTTIKLRDFEVAVWQEVATFGYPVAAVGGDVGSLDLNIRAHRGYIQRLTKPSDVKIGDHPNGFELNFNISPGMSGAPIFIHQGKKDLLIGIAVSSVRGETTEAEYSEVLEDGSKFTEKRLRIEEYGFAHDIRGLLNWSPSLAEGKTLQQLCKR